METDASSLDLRAFNVKPSQLGMGSGSDGGGQQGFTQTLAEAIDDASRAVQTGSGTVSSSDFSMPGNRSTIEDGATVDASATRERLMNEYSPEEQNKLTKRMADTGAGLRDEARSAEQQAGNYPYQFMNLAKDNPRGNLNRASYNTTLRFSRLADKLNNRLRYVPGVPSAGGGFEGEVSSYIRPGVEKYPSIETEEMRQMAANRRLDERARQAGVDLQSRIQAYPQDLQEARDKATLGLEQDILSSENAFNRTWQNAVLVSEYQGSVAQYFRKDLSRFMVDLDLGNKTRIGAYLLNELSPFAGSFMSELIGAGTPVPDAAQRLSYEVINQIYNTDNGLTSQEKAQAAAIMSIRPGIDLAVMENEVFTNVISGRDIRNAQEARDVYTRRQEIQSQRALGLGG